MHSSNESARFRLGCIPRIIVSCATFSTLSEIGDIAFAYWTKFYPQSIISEHGPLFRVGKLHFICTHVIKLRRFQRPVDFSFVRSHL